MTRGGVELEGWSESSIRPNHWKSDEFLEVSIFVLKQIWESSNNISGCFWLKVAQELYLEVEKQSWSFLLKFCNFRFFALRESNVSYIAQ